MALFIILMILHAVSASENYKNDGILQHLNTGMKFAKDFLGSESVALKVADFVVRAFQKAPSTVNQRKPSGQDHAQEPQSAENEFNERKHYLNRSPPSMSPLRHLIKLLGLQTNQISAVAVNALIFVAQMITTLLAPKSTNKAHRHDDPLKWILSKNSERLQELIATAKNESLPDLVSDLIEEQDTQEETSCISLLVCKIVPFVTKMQKVVFHEQDKIADRNIRGADTLLRYLPTREEIRKRSDICERKFKDCDINE